jgi:hypothetical protein
METVWVNLGESVAASLLKRLFMTLEGGSGARMALKWYKDFSPTPSTTTSIVLNPITTGNTFLWGNSTSLYGTTTVTTTSSGSFVVGTYYAIASLGNTTQAQWNTAAGTSGLTYIVGSVFQAATVGVGTGTVVSHTHSGSQHAATAKYAPSFSPAEYKVSMSKAAKVVRLEITQTVKGFKAALQNITIWAKQGKIR